MVTKAVNLISWQLCSSVSKPPNGFLIYSIFHSLFCFPFCKGQALNQYEEKQLSCLLPLPPHFFFPMLSLLQVRPGSAYHFLCTANTRVHAFPAGQSWTASWHCFQGPPLSEAGAALLHSSSCWCQASLPPKANGLPDGICVLFHED